MTEHTATQNTSLDNLIQLLLNEGYENGLPRIAEMILNAAMLIERRTHLSAQPYERCEKRNGYANGFKDRVFKSTLGEMNLKIPQTRESSDPFYPSLLEKGSRIDQALKSAIAEMYLQGVSTRRVKHVMAELCGMEVSSTQV
jgi:transposase-like protein